MAIWIAVVYLCTATLIAGRHWIVAGHRVKIKLFSREGQIFPGGSNFDIFPWKCKISKITVLNCCYLAVNCPKPTPSPILALFQRGRPLIKGEGRPPSIFTLASQWKQTVLNMTCLMTEMVYLWLHATRTRYNGEYNVEESLSEVYNSVDILFSCHLLMLCIANFLTQGAYGSNPKKRFFRKRLDQFLRKLMTL